MTAPIADAKRAPRRAPTSAPRAPAAAGSGILGHLLESRRDPLGLFQRAVAEHGGLVRLRMGWITAHLAAHPDCVRHVLQERHQTYGKNTPGFRVLKALLGEGLLTSDGAYWLKQRRTAQPSFSRERLAGFAAPMVRAAADAVDSWAPLIRDGRPLDLASAMMRVTLRIAGETLLSADVSQEADAVGRALAILLRELDDRILNPFRWPGFLPTRRNRDFRWALRALEGVVTGMIEARRHAEGPPPDDFLGRLMAARDPQTGEALTDRQLRDEVTTIFVAGHETTAVALTWTLDLLARHPEVRAEVESEVDEVLAGRLPSADDLPSLEATERALLESMRLYPPAWILARDAREADVLGGFAIPKGSIIFLSPYVTHRYAEVWPEPERFDPDRFQPDAVRARPAFSYFPFGGGPRQCIGKDFALLESVLVLATILSRVRFEPVDPEPVETEPLITLRPKGPVWVRVAAR